MAKVPTVRVTDDAAPDGYVIINEADYDADEHTLWGEEGGEQQDSGERESDPLLDLTVADLREAVQDVDDADRLRDALQDEGRTTAREALEGRIEEIEG